MKKCFWSLIIAVASSTIMCNTFFMNSAQAVNAASRQQHEVIFGGDTDANNMARGGGYIQGFLTHTYFHTMQQQRHIVRFCNETTPIGMPVFNTGISCGVIGGMHIIGGYNAVHPELIPGFNSVRMIVGFPAWNSSASTYRTAVANELHQRMGGGQGVTLNQYIGGMNSLAQNRGRTFHNQSMMVGGSLNLPALKAQLRQNRYATIFMLNTFNISSVSTESGRGRDRFSLEEWGGNHIMAVFGYQTRIYRDIYGDIIRTKNFLEVATGFGVSRGLLYLNDFVTIYNVHITHFS